ncbi:MAG: hypothetical protein M0R70_15540 [Nitrospirae bacterium]|nr:hypothetical protein [Nitrospirota bacterium]
MKVMRLRLLTHYSSITLLAVALFVIAMSAQGCIPEVRHYEELTGRVCDRTELQESISDLRLCVDPFVETDKLEQAFGADLISAGILPVLVSIENRHSSKAFLIEKMRFAISTNKLESASDIQPDSYPIQRRKDHDYVNCEVIKGANDMFAEKTAMAGALFFAPPIAVPLLLPAVVVLLNSGDQRINDSILVSESISRREFVDRTVYPGESHQGFIYFPFTPKDTIDASKTIKATIRDVQSEQYISFEIKLKK